MSDKWLWDRSGPIDEEIADLERLLSVRRYRAAARPRRRRIAGRVAVAATMVAVALTWWVLKTPGTAKRDLDPESSKAAPEFARTYVIEGLQGVNRCGNGDRIVVDAASKSGARIVVDTLGHVAVDPGTELRVIATHDGHEFYLERGAVEASILATPGVFRIGTPAGLTVDLGCRYRVEVEPSGVSRVQVLTGQVSFEEGGRKVFVPRGASCLSIPGRGPGSPTWDDAASAGFRLAVEAVEFATEPDAAALSVVVGTADRRDTLTLFHLLQAVSPQVREAVLRRIAELVDLPDDLHMGAVLAGSAQAIETLRREVRYYWY